MAEVDCERLEEVICEEFRGSIDVDTGVTVIPKPKKQDRLSGKSWRCISLINTTSKLLEKMRTTLITARAEAKEILKKRQYGSRRGRSAMHAVLDVIKQIRAIQEKEKDG